MNNAIKHLLCEENGVTAVEWALLSGLIAIVVVAAVLGVGVETKGIIDRVSNCVSTAVHGSLQGC